MTEIDPAPAPAPASPARNRVGTVALVLAIIAIVLPVIGFIVFLVGAALEGAEGDDFGYAVVGAFFVTAAASSLIAPIAILAVVLGIVSLFRHGQRKLPGVLAIVFGVGPSLFILGLPVAIDTFF